MTEAPVQLLRLLQRIKEQVEGDERIRGSWLVGSLATDTADVYSDIDLYLLVEDTWYKEVYAQRGAFARGFGPVLSTFEVDWPNCQLYGVILESCLEVDLCYTREDQVELFGPFRVLTDRDGDLEKWLTERDVGWQVDVAEELRSQTEFAAYDLLHAINMLGRGERWSAIRHLELLRRRVISLVGLRTKTDVGEEFRRLEHLIDPEMGDELLRTLPTYSEEGIAQAIRAATMLFTREAERVSRDHGLAFPEEGFTRLLGHLGEVSSA